MINEVKANPESNTDDMIIFDGIVLDDPDDEKELSKQDEMKLERLFYKIKEEKTLTR